MTIERFTKKQFEQALTDSQKDSTKPLWEYVGFEMGEHVYKIQIVNGSVKRVAILIRSSIKQDGIAASTGKDSIRMWLVNTTNNKPLGKKVDAYTTRVAGWSGRMQTKIRKLYKQGLQMVNCPTCGSGVMIERHGKYGKFYGCSNYPKCRKTLNSLDGIKVEPKKKEHHKDGLDFLEIEEDTTPKVKLQWSQYQKDIFDFVENGTGNAVVEAVPGSGKTTTGLEALNYTPKNKSIAFVAFVKRIAVELSDKAPSHVHVSTLHSLGFANIRNALGKTKVDDSKCYWILKDWLERLQDKRFVESVGANTSSVLRLVSLCKATLLEPTNDNLNYLSANYNVNTNGDEKDVYKAVTHVFKVSANETWRIDFDDMIFFCAKQMVPCKKFDFLFVDEAQDLNKAQIKFVLNSTNENSRVIAIGDSNQSIFGFRGADTNAIPNLIEALDAKLLPLDITYRCPASHVELAQTIVSKIQPWENAKEGNIENIDKQQFIKLTSEGDMVLCRTNAPLIAPALQLIRNGKKAVVLGRDIGEGLISLIEKIESKRKPQTLSNLLYELSEYMYEELTKLLAQNKESKAQHLEDQIATIDALSDGCKTISDLKSRIKSIFSNQAKGITFSSVHKAKGLESESVFILHPELMPHPLAMKSENIETIQQERNIKYVALTRSKNNLYFVR